MKPNKQAKWIVGITGTALSAFILSQLDTNSTSNNNQKTQQVSYQNEAPAVSQEGLSNREKELANKDWSNFSVESNAKNQTTDQSTSSSTVQQPTDSSINQRVAQPINPPTDRNTSRS